MKHVRLHIGFPAGLSSFLELYVGKGKNVTTNSFFTSYGLAKQLRQKTSIVGLINKVRRELPPPVAIGYSSVLMKADKVAPLTLYQCKPKKMSVFS